MLHPLANKHRHLFERSGGFIFLVSHMRSYSTLLGHLLAETPSIDGYCELHQDYGTELDLLRMPLDVQATYDSPLAGAHLFDKLLHRTCSISAKVCERDDVRIIFSIRTPAATLASMVALGERDESVRWAADPSQALLHYQRRLSDIRKLAEHAPNAALLVADALVTNTRATLDSLQRFLGIPDRIPEVYSLHARTGEPRFGDSSAAIRSGTIRPPQAETADQAHNLPPQILAEGAQAFAEVLDDPRLMRLTRIDATTG